MLHFSKVNYFFKLLRDQFHQIVPSNCCQYPALLLLHHFYPCTGITISDFDRESQAI